jgi:hypothetical protein
MAWISAKAFKPSCMYLAPFLRPEAASRLALSGVIPVGEIHQGIPGAWRLDIYRRSRPEICAPKGLDDSAQGFNPGN